MDRVSLGKNYFLQGYNCAQSVALAFSDIIDLDKDTLLKAVSAFGGGMGRMREVCGAVSAMNFVLGLIKGYSEAKDNEGKRKLYQITQKGMNDFKLANGSYICKQLLSDDKHISPIPEVRSSEYYKKRPCHELVGDAVRILENLLQEK